MNLSSKKINLTPKIVLQAYSAGIFPMAKNRSGREIFWVDPEKRGIIPLNGIHVPRSLRKSVRNSHLNIRYNTNFNGIISGCAKQNIGREETWINDEIIALYTQLFDEGYVQTVECWMDEVLVGGLYGISLKGAFFGESMFSLKKNASKIALIHLIARLNEDGFTLLDTQFITDHLARLGAIEIPRSEYLERLEKALLVDAKFNIYGSEISHQYYIDQLFT